MSTPDPLDGIMLPYTVTFYPTNSTFMYPDAVQRGNWANSYYMHRLGPGSYMLQVTYYSKGQNLRLRFEPYGTVHTFESGQTGWLTSPVMQVAVNEGEELFYYLQSTGSFSGADRGEVAAAVNVYPMSTYQP